MTRNTENSFGTGSDSNEILRVREYNIDTLHYKVQHRYLTLQADMDCN